MNHNPYDVYLSMGFSASLCYRAPTDIDLGAMWLLTASSVGTMPKRLRRDGEFTYTFYGSTVIYQEETFTVTDYEPDIEIIKLEGPDTAIWVSLSDASLEFRNVVHGTKPVLRNLQVHEKYPLPPLDLQMNAMPMSVRDELVESKVIEEPRLCGNWDFTSSVRDGNSWLSLLKLTNKYDPDVRFTPVIKRPPPVTSVSVMHFRKEIVSKIELYCMTIDDQRFVVQAIIHTSHEHFNALMETCTPEKEAVFRDLRTKYARAREYMRNKSNRWREACVAPFTFDKIEHVEENIARVHLSLTEWAFHATKSTLRTCILFYTRILFTKIFQPMLSRFTFEAAAEPDYLLPPQKYALGHMIQSEKQGVYNGWYTRQEESGFLWSYSVWGDLQRGPPPERCGGLFYSPAGSGKTVTMVALCAQRKSSTLVLVSKRADVRYWVAMFQRFAPDIRVHGITKCATPMDTTADVTVTTWQYYKNFALNDYTWSRVIVDNIHAFRINRIRVEGLKEVRRKSTWLLTNNHSVHCSYREILGLPSNILDKIIRVPKCDIDAFLSPVVREKICLTTSPVHRRLKNVFKLQNAEDPKTFYKYQRLVNTQIQFAPKNLFASYTYPQYWEPRLKEDLPAEERVQNALKEPCPICYEPIENAVVSPCKHVFCNTCMMRHVKESFACPICRDNVQHGCCFIVKEDDSQHIYDRKHKRWSYLSADVCEDLQKVKKKSILLDEIQDYVNSLKGRCVFVAEVICMLDPQNTQIDIWTDAKNFSTTYKQLLRGHVDITRADHLLCLGCVDYDELERLTRRIQSLEDNKTRKIHLLYVH